MLHFRRSRIVTIKNTNIKKVILQKYLLNLLLLTSEPSLLPVYSGNNVDQIIPSCSVSDNKSFIKQPMKKPLKKVGTLYYI